MTGSKKQNRKTPTKGEITALPAGVKAVIAPKNAARRKLLETPDVATNGGGRSVHVQPVDR